MKPKIIITGVAGFVGTNFAEYLLKEGYSIIGFDVGDRLKRLKTSGLLRNESFSFYEANLAKENPFSSFESEKIEAIFHFAALPHVDYSSHFPEEVIENNIGSLLNTIRFAINLKCPLIFSSSVEIYGGSEDKIYKEVDTPMPLSPYAASKVAGEAIIRSYIETQGLKTTIFRFTNLYGPWQAPDRLVPRVLSQLLIAHQPMIEKGTNRDFIFVSDACIALRESLKLDHSGEIYNLSSGKGIDNSEVAAIISNLNGKKKIATMKPRTRDGRGKYLVSDPTKLMNALAWSPQVSLEEGINQTYSWYKNNLSWVTQFKTNLLSDRNSKHFLVDSSTWR
jgi:dTDP-glucose 4,6-dehydratase